MSFIFTSDIHLDDSPANEYRWGLFPWLKEQAIKNKVDYVIIGGDITDRKDNHEAVFVNRIIDSLVDLAKSVRVIVYKGNHDFIDEDTPFFKFINLMGMENLVYYIKPTERRLNDKNCLFLPCTRNHTEVWEDLDFSKYDIIFCHETFKGAISESGIRLDGISSDIFAGASARVISGDIHVPQRLSNIEYCGAPYRIRFGDSFDARVILYDKDVIKNLHYPCMRKHTVELFDSEDTSWVDTVSEGDQVKFRVNLKRSDMHDWDRHKQKLLQLAKAHKITVHGVELKLLNKQLKLNEKKDSSEAKKISTEDFYQSYCLREKIGPYEKELGASLLR